MSPSSQRPRVSVVIKTLNEARHINRAIESALVGLAEGPGEVIVADSCSQDETVALACAWPVTVVQLAHAHERCCGVGPQLGYQHAQGDFIYILDGDMRLHPGFLKAALTFLQDHPQAAGVGGMVLEQNRSSLEYQARVARGEAHMQAGWVDRLDMGGLYRRAAIEQVGYFSDRNLHSYEELDLALRLRQRGWLLYRLAEPAVDHWGHDLPATQLLRKRWDSHYIDGIGELVRAAWGQAHWPLLTAQLRELRLYLAAAVWMLLWLALGVLSAWVFGQGSGLLLGPLLGAALSWLAYGLHKRSLRAGSYAWLSLWAHVGGLLRGLWRPRRSPQQGSESVVLQRGQVVHG